MATTAEGQALTEAHRRAQIANAAAVAALVSGMWANLDLTSLTTATNYFLQLIFPSVELGQAKSALIATRYAEKFRVAELGLKLPRPATSRTTFEPVTTLTLGQLEASMRAVAFGPAARLERKISVTKDSPEMQRALRTQLTNLQTGVHGSVQRHVGNGGRATLRNIVEEQDRQALGYIRVTRAKPCYFCAMLASRGPVYGDDSFDDSDPRFEGQGNVKVHDSCHCTIEPVYSSKTAWPGRGREFEGMWRDSDGTLAGFRRLYEGRAL